MEMISGMTIKDAMYKSYNETGDRDIPLLLLTLKCKCYEPYLHLHCTYMHTLYCTFKVFIQRNA